MNAYNGLNAHKVNHYEIGICPTCGKRLTAECEHMNTEQAQEWLAAKIAAEQGTNEADVHDHIESADILDWLPVELTPKRLAVMDENWQAEATAEHADWLDEQRTQEDARR